jgi:hypothetical protein
MASEVIAPDDPSALRAFQTEHFEVIFVDFLMLGPTLSNPTREKFDKDHRLVRQTDGGL